jgi:hypothetical protein
MKDVYTLFDEALADLRKSPEKEKKFRSLVPIGGSIPVECQLNCALSVLKGNIEEARRSLNGRHEVFTESDAANKESVDKVEGYKKEQYLSAKVSGMNEAEARGFSGYTPKSGEGEALSESDKQEYSKFIALNFTPADALKLTRKGIRL